ncbi:MAG: FMN-binding negative transcriptional regulator [Burkholderiales bacterium]
MYNPKHFVQNDLRALRELIHAYGFATLISHSDGEFMVSHIPIMLDETSAPKGKLIGHLARTNPHCQILAKGGQALVIFQGPHTYISPSWYEQPKRMVPTWNYTIAHVYGAARIVEDKIKLKQIVGTLVHQYESGFAQPWTMDLPDDFLDANLNAIVGFEIDIERIEGKFKISQNRTVADQQRVIAALEKQADAMSREMAKLMQQRLKTQESA